MLKESSSNTGMAAINFAEGPHQGPPLVLLHGLPGRWQEFLPILPTLLLRWHTYALDFRGQGKSGRAPGQYLSKYYAADVEQFLRQQLNEPAILFGLSAGGAVDALSDYDVILIVQDLEPYAADHTWLQDFGDVLVVYWDPVRPDPVFGIDHTANVTQYAGGLKIDFTLWPVALFRRIVAAPALPAELDAGYRVLLDKDGGEAQIPHWSFTLSTQLPGILGSSASRNIGKHLTGGRHEQEREIPGRHRPVGRGDHQRRRGRSGGAGRHAAGRLGAGHGPGHDGRPRHDGRVCQRHAGA